MPWKALASTDAMPCANTGNINSRALSQFVEPKGFDTERDGRIAVHVHQVVRDKSGKIVADRMVEHVYTTRDGLITSMEIRNPKS